MRYQVNAIPVRLALWTLGSALLGCTDRVSTQSADDATAFIAGDAASVIDAGDEAWLKAAPAAWSLVERDALRLEPRQTKAQYDFYDALFSYHSTQLLYAALETDEETALATAREALELIESRHARWYSGEDEKFREVEDVFLTLEGVGNFAGYAWLVHAQGGAASPAAAIQGMRRGGRRWSQDEGMAVFLVLERLNPQWMEYAFSTAPKAALQLLAKAVESD